MESLTVADVKGLKPNSGALTLFTNDKGGIEDDLIVSNAEDHLYVVSNAGCRENDIRLMKDRLEAMQREGGDVHIEFIDDRGLVALQGEYIILSALSIGLHRQKQKPFLICLHSN